MIEDTKLKEFGAIRKCFRKNEMIFLKHEQAHFYYQIISGSVKMNNYNEQGKEFVQGIFAAKESFGEPPLFGHFPYPANAVALEECEVWKLEKQRFYSLIENSTELLFRFTVQFSKRLQYKSVMAVELSSQTPEHRLLTLLKYLKQKATSVSEPFSYQISQTRQQLADLTGLRVETVIRTLKKLDQEEKLKINHRKIFF